MKIAMLIVRSLVGALFVFGAVVFLFGLIAPPPMPDGPLKSFNEGLAASGYFFMLLKVTELVCGILLLTGRFVPLALVILSPIVINILMVHTFLDRTGLPVAAFLTAAFVFLGYYYRKAFAPLLTPKYE
ncbi:MAG TPA: DoxX family membrane protein [Pyrinomonadaceae bacterium]|nr:DoxX family membrane protein [Pyrinomonadaceae bacterium]